MNLREYLFRKRLKLMDFAKEIGYDRNYVGAVMSGRMKETKKFRKVVQMYTKGEVTSVYSGEESDVDKD